MKILHKKSVYLFQVGICWINLTNMQYEKIQISSKYKVQNLAQLKKCP